MNEKQALMKIFCAENLSHRRQFAKNASTKHWKKSQIIILGVISRIFMGFSRILGRLFDALLETGISWKAQISCWFSMNFKGPNLQNLTYFGCFSWVNRWCISEALFSWIWVSFLMTFGMLLGFVRALIFQWFLDGFLGGPKVEITGSGEGNLGGPGALHLHLQTAGYRIQDTN